MRGRGIIRSMPAPKSDVASPHEMTILLGTRHMVRLAKLVAADADDGQFKHDAEQYLRLLDSSQRADLRAAIEHHEDRLLTKGVSVE